MKLSHALGVVAVSSCLWAGCASMGSASVAGVAPARGVSGALASGAASAVARGIGDDRAGSALMGGAVRDDFRVNESASFSDRDPQFAGPTPQVPIPHDGRQGQPTDW